MLSPTESVQGLLFMCSEGKESEDCPLKEVRRLPLLQKIAWFDARSPEEIKEILEKHNLCSAHRQTLEQELQSKKED